MFKMMAIIKIMEAVAWTRKYLVAASVDRGLALLIIIGMMASILISRPIQVDNQCMLNNTIIVPENNVMRIAEAVNGLISTGRI